MTRAAAFLLTSLTAAGTGIGQVEFQRDILPILEQVCVRCHGAPFENSFGLTVQPKGGLRLDGREWILVGGRNGAAVVPGDPTSSPLFKRTSLPADDPDRMPNQGEPLTAAQRERIAEWIRRGADFGGWEGAEGPGPEAVARAQAAAIANTAERRPARVRLFETLAVGLGPPPEQAVTRASDPRARVMPVIPGSPLLRAEFVSDVASVTDAELARLEPVAGHITVLGLGGTGIGDAGLRTLRAMPKLTHLDLHGTAITDAGLEEIAARSELRYLNLHSTAVTDRGVQALGRLPDLSALYLWNTAVTDEGVATLQELLPGTRISHRLDLAPGPRPAGRRGRRR